MPQTTGTRDLPFPPNFLCAIEYSSSSALTCFKPVRGNHFVCACGGGGRGKEGEGGEGLLVGDVQAVA